MDSTAKSSFEVAQPILSQQQSNPSSGGVVEELSQRFLSESKNDFSLFTLREYNGKRLSVKGSFAPYDNKWTVFIRAFFFAWTAATYLADLCFYPPEQRYMFLGYLTNWTFTVSLAYQFLALSLVTFWKSKINQPGPDNDYYPNSFVKTLWVLYSIAAPAQVTVFVIYWGLEYSGSVLTYFDIMKHGIIGIMIFIDGLVVSLIPIRIKHFLFFSLYGILYLAWNYLHFILSLGNGVTTTDDDTLYTVMNWSENPSSAFRLSIFVVFIVAPVVYFYVWSLSLLSSLIFCNNALMGERVAAVRVANEGTAGNDDDDDNITPHHCCVCSFDGSRRHMQPELEAGTFETTDYVMV